MSEDPKAVSAAWQVWVAECLLGGRLRDEVARRLEAQGVAADDARDVVARIDASPAMIAARKERKAREADGMLRRLLSTVEGLGAARLPEVASMTTEVLRDVYVAHSQPVVMRGMCRGWPAWSRWTLDQLRRRVGDAMVKVCMGRTGRQRPDPAFAELTVEMTMAEYIDEVVARSPTNDLYMLANHHNLRGPLVSLVEDLPTPPMVDSGRISTCTSFWFGPAGTVTPAHHDTTNIVFCQILGRKRIWLAAPWSAALSEAATGFYSGVQLSSGDLPDGVVVYEVTLEPGDAILLPVGWWHEVRALEIGISLSFTGMVFPNRFDFYAPGRR